MSWQHALPLLFQNLIQADKFKMNVNKSNNQKIWNMVPEQKS